MSRRPVVLCGLVLALAGATNAVAQSTGMPVSMPPLRSYQTYTMGATLADPGPGIAIEAWYGMPVGPGDIDVRLGLWDTNGGSNVVLVGADYRQQLLTHSERFPLDGALTAGFGANFNSDASVFLLPVGFTMGRRFDLEDSTIKLQPYGQPLIHFVFGDTSDDVLFSVGLGLEAQFSDQFALDVNGTLGDLDGISIAFAYLH